MHVTGVTGYARGAGLRGASVTRVAGSRVASRSSWPRAISWHGATSWGGWRRVGRELVLVAILAAAYEAIRDFMVQAGGAAGGHALSVVAAEGALGLFDEQAVAAGFVRWSDDPARFNL